MPETSTDTGAAQAPSEAAGSLSQNPAFALARRAAVRVMRRRARLFRLVRSAYARLARHEQALAWIRDDLRTLLRLARTWARREYRAVPWRSVLYAVAALLYFVNPVDLIPDALAGIGFVDDVAVVGAVVRAIRADLERFRRWEGGLDAPGERGLLPE